MLQAVIIRALKSATCPSFPLLVVLVGFLAYLPKMDAIECFSTTDDRMVQFYCGPSEQCCGARCCSDDDPFYIHWYFWLAVCMLLLVVAGFALSACRHFRKQRKYHQCHERNKPGFGADLLLNYHLMRTDVISLPPYEDVMSRDQSHVTIPTIMSIPPPPPLPSLPPPPPYCDACCSDVSSASGDVSSHPPPSYTDCVMQD